MARIGDAERERAAGSLRRHYVSGRLDLDELSQRTELVLRARSRRELARAFDELPLLPDLAAIGQVAKRGAIVAALAGVWLVFSLVMLVAFAAALLVHGPSLAEVVGFPLVWVAVTWALWRLGRPRRRT